MKSVDISSPSRPRRSSRTTRPARLAAVVAALLVTGAPAARSQSLILSDQPGWNGWQVKANVKAGFRKAGTATEVAVSDEKTLSISPFGLIPGEVVTMPRASVSMLPASGAAKDKAEGAVEFSYRVGSATAADSFQFAIPSTTSAVNAQHSFGGGLENADAFFECQLTLETYAPLTGTTLQLPDMPVLAHGATSTEDMLALIDGPAVGFLLPGDAGFSYPLTLDGSPGAGMFRYTLTYSIVTPFGRDPVVSYRFAGEAAGPAGDPLPLPTASEESVRALMPQVKLNRLMYEDGMGVGASVCFRNAADIEPHAKVLLVSPENSDVELLSLLATADPLVFTSAEIAFKTAGAATKFDSSLVVPPGKMFSAIYYYHLSQAIVPDQQKGLKPGERFSSSDFGIAFDPNFPEGSVVLTPQIALTDDEESPAGDMRLLGTLAIEGLPGIVQIASEDLIFAPASAAQEAAFAARAGASFVSDDAAWKGPNGQAVWKRYQLNQGPALDAERAARVRYLPQMLALVGTAGKLHGSNERVLGLFAIGLELWLEGFDCAVNPRVLPTGHFSAPEARRFTSFFPGEAPILPDDFDSMLSPSVHLDDPRQKLRDLWTETAMQDNDAETINVAFIDSSFAPNPDFKGFPDAIPQFNMVTGAHGSHVAELPESAAAGRDALWHGNGTVAVAGGVMGNRYGVAGVGGQLVQPMLYYMGTASFVFESGQAMELAVADGADIINMSAGFPCRILSVLGPVRICSETDRAAVAATVAALAASASAVVCASTPLIDAFVPGLGSGLCATSSVAATTAIGALFDSLFLNAIVGDPRHPMERGIAAAKAAGVPLVTSAGNQRQFNWDSLGEFKDLFQTDNFRTDAWEIIPAVIPDAICVSSVALTGGYPNTQFFGPAVDLWAPEGQPVLLPIGGTDTSAANVAPEAQALRAFSGSSAAAPFVSGVIAHMMAVNPSMDPHRASAGQRATGVARITATLTSSATVPGSAADFPASDPSNVEIGHRGLMVNAYAARDFARASAGVVSLAATGFDPSFARFDNEGLSTADGAVIEQITVPSSGTVVRFGGLPAGDVDTWDLIMPSAAGIQIPNVSVKINVPVTTGPPPVLMNGTSTIPRVSLSSTLAVYELRIVGCEARRLRLSCPGPVPLGGSPLRRNDVLYQLNIELLGLVTTTTPDRFEDPGHPNDQFPTGLNPDDWGPYAGLSSLGCSFESKQMTVPDVTLSGCADDDLYLIPQWPDYEPGAASWGTLRVELDPPVPSASLQFFEDVRTTSGTRREPAGRPASGSLGVAINADAHPLPIYVRVAGSSATPFSLKITFCLPNSAFIDNLSRASGRRSGRNGAMEFWESLREARLIQALGPIDFGIDLTCQMRKFGYPRDGEGRSMQGQLFTMSNATPGPLRVLGIPGSGDASVRFDLFDMTGVLVGSAATRDLLGDPDLEFNDTVPHGVPCSLQTGDQPAGDYILAVSGFHLLDSWTLLFGEGQSALGQPNAEGLGKPDPAQLLDLPPSEDAQAASVGLMGGPFATSLLPGVTLTFPQPQGGWRAEYSLDGKVWNEAGRACDLAQQPCVGSFPLPGGGGGGFGLVRIRGLAGREEIPPSASAAATFIATPTQPGFEYSLGASGDLGAWGLGETSPGDGSVFEWVMPTGPGQDFFRVYRK